MENITIGEILKAQGIKGEVKVRPLTDDVSRYRKLRLVYVEGRPYRLLHCRMDNEFVYLTLEGITDRNQAESLRGKTLQIDRVNAVTVDEDAFFIADIVGCALTDEQGAEMAVITDVLQFGAADVIVARDGAGKELRFPFLNRIVDRIDIEAKRFAVYRDKLQEVCVYDD